MPDLKQAAERKAFEAWYAALPNNGRKASLTLLDAWQARAALAAEPSKPVKPYICGDCRHADSDGIPLAKSSQLACHYESINPHNPAHIAAPAAPVVSLSVGNPPKDRYDSLL